MKRLCLIMVTLVAGMALVSATGNREEAPERAFTIGISKIVTHPALDAIEQGMKDYLAEQGFTIRYDTQSANGDISTAASIAQKFKADK